MKKNFYFEGVDLRSRKAMQAFLENHFKYYLANSWNAGEGYANNVKLQKLGLPRELQDKFFDFLSTAFQDTDFYFEYLLLKDEFKEETGFDVFFNGRSAGYLVLDMQISDAEDMSFEELKETVKTVARFDFFCAKLRCCLIDFLKTHSFVDEEYTVKKTRKVAVAV